MLSLSSILNPAPPELPNIHTFPLSPDSSCPSGSSADDPYFPSQSTGPKQKLSKDTPIFTKSKPTGVINFPPYENLDELSRQRVRSFQIFPLGEIKEYSKHIPYNSGKKDFSVKTGRESFEVFLYIFSIPGDNAEYTVMWDYNIGLVRMTSFFKCCKYPKTTPAKMLNSNPGLKEITHSITGGSIMAQGYWMPYECAKAVCATFCHDISGALIPIFGCDFPVLCTPPDAPEFARMIIDSATIMSSTREAENYRRLYNDSVGLRTALRNDNSDTRSKRDRRVFQSPYDENNRHHPQYRIRISYHETPASETSPYATDAECETSPDSAGYQMSRQRSRPANSMLSSALPPLRRNYRDSANNGSWVAANVPHSTSPASLYPNDRYQVATAPNPWLSAVPGHSTVTGPSRQDVVAPNGSRLRSPLIATNHSIAHWQRHPQSPFAVHPRSHAQPPSQVYHYPNVSLKQQLPSPTEAPPLTSLRGKQSTAHVAETYTYKCTDSERFASAVQEPRSTVPQQMRTTTERDRPEGSGSGADKNAALLLINLSVRDQQHQHYQRQAATGRLLWGHDDDEESKNTDGIRGLRHVAAAATAAIHYRGGGGGGGGGGGNGQHGARHNRADANCSEGTAADNSPPSRPLIRAVRSNSM